MSFRFISLPLWIILCMLLSIYLIYTGIKRRRVEKKGLLAVYFTIAPIGLLAALYRLIDEVVRQYKKYNEYILYVIVAFLLVAFLELLYMGIINKGNDHLKRLMKIAGLIVLISSIPIIILIVIDVLGFNR